MIDKYLWYHHCNDFLVVSNCYCLDGTLFLWKYSLNIVEELEAWTPDLSTAKPGELYLSTLDYFQTFPNIAKLDQEGIGIAVDSLSTCCY